MEVCYIKQTTRGILIKVDETFKVELEKILEDFFFLEYYHLFDQTINHHLILLYIIIGHIIIETFIKI